MIPFIMVLLYTLPVKSVALVPKLQPHNRNPYVFCSFTIYASCHSNFYEKSPWHIRFTLPYQILPLNFIQIQNHNIAQELFFFCVLYYPYFFYKKRNISSITQQKVTIKNRLSCQVHPSAFAPTWHYGHPVSYRRTVSLSDSPPSTPIRFRKINFIPFRQKFFYSHTPPSPKMENKFS